jgi:hypothetical protein
MGPESLGGDDEEEDENGVEGEVTPPPHSPPPEDLPSLDDIFNRQAGIYVSARRTTWSRTKTGSVTGPPPQPHLALVCPDLQGVSVVLVVIGMSRLLGVLQVPPYSSAARVITAMLVGPSSSGAEDAEPPAKKVCPWFFLPVSSRYGIVRWLAPPPFLLL